MTLSKLFDKKCVQLGGLALLALWAVVSIVLSYFKIRINEDSSYYIGVVRLILDGKIPFKDFFLGYTPLSFYLLSVPCKIFGCTFNVGIFFIYLLHFCNALILYKVCRKYVKSIPLATYCAILCFILCLGRDGRIYVLEPFVLMFGLSALYVQHLKFQWRDVVAGFLCFCAFWCKQYGLGFICLCMALILLRGQFCKKSWRQTVQLLIGFFAGAIFFVSILSLIGVPLSDLINLSGSDYERDGLYGLFGSWKAVCISLPLLVISIILMFSSLKNYSKHAMLIVAFFGIAGFLLQCYVRFYSHYMMLAMPFCVLMLLLCADTIKTPRYRKIYLSTFILSSIIPCYFMQKTNMELCRSNERASQEKCACIIREHIPNGSKDVFTGMTFLPTTLQNEYEAPLLDKYGLSNGFVRKSEEVLELIKASRYCLISSIDFEKKEKYSYEVHKYLSENFNMQTLSVPEELGKCYFYTRKSNY